MNFKLTFSLVIVMLLVLAGFLGIQRWKNSHKEPENPNALLVPAPKDIQTISCAQDGSQQLAFAQEANVWKMTFPVAAPAEAWQIAQIADSLKELRFKDKFEPAADGPHSAQATGTDKPRHIITFSEPEGKTYSLALGKRTVGGIYATLNGGKTIYLLDSNPLDKLDKDPDEFRSKEIRQIAIDQIYSLTIKHKNQTIALEKGGGSKWLIDAPIKSRANADTIRTILNEFKAIRATGFSDLTRDMPAAGLNPPVFSVTAMYVAKPTPPATGPASQPGGVPVTLDLGYYTDLTSKKTVYASIGGSKEVFTLSVDAFTRLNRELKDLRDPDVTPAPVVEANEISVSTDGHPTLNVVKKDGKWTITSSSPPLSAGDLEVGNLLGDIRNLRAIKFVDNAGDLKAIGLDPPHIRLDLGLAGQSQHEVLLIGKPETADAVTPMMRQGEPTVYLVQTRDADNVVPTEMSLRDKIIERLNTDRIRAISITNGGVTTVLEREGTAWKVKANGKTETADDVKMTSLLADFSPLTATKYLANAAEPAGTPVDVSVTLTIAELPATAPATSPSTLPSLTSGVVGPEPAKIVTRTLKLYKVANGAALSWKAVWDAATPLWTWEPTNELANHLYKETYAIPAPATQPVTQPAKE